MDLAAPGLLHWKLSNIFFCFPQGLSFVDTFYKFCTKHQFNTDGFHPECKKWVLLLLQLVDVTGDDHPEVHLRSFLSMSTHSVVVKKYREDIIKHVSSRNCLAALRVYLDVEHLVMCSPSNLLFFIQVIGQTRTKFPQLTLQKFFPLYKAFPIWPNQVRGCPTT